MVRNKLLDYVINVLKFNGHHINLFFTFQNYFIFSLFSPKSPSLWYKKKSPSLSFSKLNSTARAPISPPNLLTARLLLTSTYIFSAKEKNLDKWVSRISKVQLFKSFQTFQSFFYLYLPENLHFGEFPLKIKNL